MTLAAPLLPALLARLGPLQVQARKVMETVYQAAGSTAIFANQPFERRFRDLHAVTQQVQAHASNLELVGRHFLGMNPKSKYL